MDTEFSIIINSFDDLKLVIDYFTLRGINPLYSSEYELDKYHSYGKWVAVKKFADAPLYFTTQVQRCEKIFRIPPTLKKFTEEQKTMILLGWFPFDE